MLFYFNIFDFDIYCVCGMFISLTCGVCDVEAPSGCLMLNSDTSWLGYSPDVSEEAFEANSSWPRAVHCP